MSISSWRFTEKSYSFVVISLNSLVGYLAEDIAVFCLFRVHDHICYRIIMYMHVITSFTDSLGFCRPGAQ